jgi:hypothetical protein
VNDPPFGSVQRTSVFELSRVSFSSKLTCMRTPGTSRCFVSLFCSVASEGPFFRIFDQGNRSLENLSLI